MRKFLERYIYLTLIVLFLTGVIAGRGFHLKEKEISNIAEDIHPVREKNSQYSFINPLLTYELPNAIELHEYEPLAKRVGKIISNFSRDNNSSIAVYYRDLATGRWFGFNQDDKYTPASLMKVVLMITYYKQSETVPGLLGKRIKFSKETKDIINILPYDQGTGLVLDKYYTVNELLEKMVINSDNGATYALLNDMGDEVLDHVYTDLGLQNPAKIKGQYTISAKDYVLFLRVLYNATYLNREMSEKALALLSRSSFQEGLRAGVDTSVKVASKYGESVMTREDNTIAFVELHDCGILYVPDKPYLLCVMTRGDNLGELKKAIRNISATIYREVK